MAVLSYEFKAMYVVGPGKDPHRVNAVKQVDHHELNPVRP